MAGEQESLGAWEGKQVFQEEIQSNPQTGRYTQSHSNAYDFRGTRMGVGDDLSITRDFSKGIRRSLDNKQASQAARSAAIKMASEKGGNHRRVFRMMVRNVKLTTFKKPGLLVV